MLDSQRKLRRCAIIRHLVPNFKFELLKFTQKWKFCYQLLTLMLFQTHKTFVHLQNTNEDISDEIWELSDFA